MCAASDIGACKNDAVAIFQTTPKVAFEFDAGVKIPLLLMESTAHIKFGNGQFTANIASSGFLGIFKTDLQILANSKKFELTATSTLDFKQAVDNVAKAVDTAIEAAFDGMLKITEYVDKLNDYISKGIDRLCSVLGLDKIKIELFSRHINRRVRWHEEICVWRHKGYQRFF